MRMAWLGRMRVITAMDRDKRGSHDRIWAVRTHPSPIGSRFRSNKRYGGFGSGMTPTN
jgi:hypothetical protein